MQRLILMFCGLLVLTPALNAQFFGQEAPPNDICAKAVALAVGDRLGGHSNAEATTSLEFERPATVETTCIQTIENDVWYKFKAEPGVALYEVQITTGFCTTPAGLQALLIKADGCSATKFTYRACSNKINTDTIKLYLDDPAPDQNYFVWIDGYDGTICEFDIALIARKTKQPADYRFMRFDYATPDEVPVERPELTIGFDNNAATLHWASDQREGNALFIIELLPDLLEVDASSKYARVVGFVEARTLVGQGMNEYAFTDYITPYNNGKTYRYRIILVDESGQRSVSQTIVTKAKLVESYEVREVKQAPEAGKYEVHYINRKKGQRFEVSVEDVNGKVIKQMVLDKEPARDGMITIDMNAFDAGQYFFVMACGRDQFRREFVHGGH